MENDLLFSESDDGLATLEGIWPDQSYDAEVVVDWLVSTEGLGMEEGALDWLGSIGKGAATGAATGVAAGPWGALIGGLVGGGLGALGQAQKDAQKRPAAQRPPIPAPAVSRPHVPVPAPAVSRPHVPVPAPAVSRPHVPTSGQKPTSDALNQLLLLLPQLISLLPKTGGREAIESAEGALDFFRSLTLTSSDADQWGIEGPIPDISEAGSPAEREERPDYPHAASFIPAAPGNYLETPVIYTIVPPAPPPRPFRRVVIHITDGGANIQGPVSWFRNPNAKVSGHYIVGQNGEVIQMVRNKDVAYHARGANSDSFGIEHVANTRGLVPTVAQYRSSARLVQWLCRSYSIPLDRSHIVGHVEASPDTSHTGCPNAVWDWDLYMGLVTATGTPEQVTNQEDAEWYGPYAGPGIVESGEPAWESEGVNEAEPIMLSEAVELEPETEVGPGEACNGDEVETIQSEETEPWGSETAESEEV